MPAETEVRPPPGRVVAWLVFAVVLVGLAYAGRLVEQGPRDVAYADLLTQIDEGNVSDVVFNPDRTKLRGTFVNGDEFRLDYDTQGAARTIQDHLRRAGVAFDPDGNTGADIAYRYSSSVAALVQYGVMLAVLLLIARGLPRRAAFGLRRPDSWPRAGGYAALVLVAIWIAGAVLAPFLDAEEEQGLVPEEWDSSRVGAFAAFFVTVAFVAPVVEELTFRGLGFSLLAPYGAWLAIILTGTLFAASHGLLLGFPVLLVFGLGVGWLRARTESVYPSMLLHGVFNGVALIVSVAVFG